MGMQQHTRFALPTALFAVPLALAACALIPLSPALADTHAAQEMTPADQVLAIYREDRECVGDCLTLSARLAKAFADEDARMEESGDPVGRLGFAWTVNGQDALITNARVKVHNVIGAAKGEPQQQVVTALFDNFGNAQVIDYYFIKEGGMWKLDEAVSRTPGFDWVLSLLLRYGFYGHDE